MINDNVWNFRGYKPMTKNSIAGEGILASLKQTETDKSTDNSDPTSSS